jgi:DNA-binding MarR family transcriptional regulator
MWSGELGDPRPLRLDFMKDLEKITDYLGTEPLRKKSAAARMIWLWLLEHDQVTISQRDLAKVLGVTPRTITVSILALESAGLLVRQADTVEGKGGQTFCYMAKLPKVR